MSEHPADRSPSGLVRAGWTGAGLFCVGLGGLGVVLPGLPSTVFFIAAAACFSRSSPRLEAWVLDLRGVGPLVRDYRAGLGMPRRVKAIAIASIVVFAGLSVWLAVVHPLVTAAIALAGVAGVAYVAWRVPTHERVLAADTTEGTSRA